MRLIDTLSPTVQYSFKIRLQSEFYLFAEKILSINKRINDRHWTDDEGGEDVFYVFLSSINIHVVIWSKMISIVTHKVHNKVPCPWCLEESAGACFHHPIWSSCLSGTLRIA